MFGNGKALGKTLFTRAFSLDEDSAVSFLRTLMGKAMGVMRNSVGSLRLSYCQNHDWCAILDGSKECSLAKVGDTVLALQNTLSDLLESKLLLGFEAHQSFRARCDRLVDHLSMSTAGCNSLSLGQNESICAESYMEFLSHLTPNPVTAAQFFKKGRRNEDLTSSNPKERVSVSGILSVKDNSVLAYTRL